MLIAINVVHDNIVPVQIAPIVDNINDAIENLIVVDETTSMYVENLSIPDDFAQFVNAMSPEQRRMMCAQIIAAIETCDDLTNSIERMFA